MIDERNSSGLIAGGFSNGETILVPNTKTSADIFMILFHELGHNIDFQHDIKEVIRPINEIKSATIPLSADEASWLLNESNTGWAGTGITDHHRSIIRKLFGINFSSRLRSKSKYSRSNSSCV